MLREVQELDRRWADAFVEALRSCFAGDARSLVEFTDKSLDEYGGRLFDGYREGWSEE
jgi:hypothetical protein